MLTMARKQTKRQKQQADLRRMMNTGPFQWSDVAETHYNLDVASSGDLSDAIEDLDHPFRIVVGRFDETDNSDVRVQLDCEHARAKVMSKQTASQFGYGIYDFDLFVRPSTQAVNADNTEPSLGYAQAYWFHPTPLRMDALRALKGVEALDDEHAAQSAESRGKAPAANMLLGVPIDEHAANATGRTMVKGTKIIRFGYSNQNSPVARHSSYTVNLDPHQNTNLTGAFETQHYTLTGDNEKAFGIFDRMEAAINPYSDPSQGERLVETEWAFPMSYARVTGPSSAAAPMTWALAQADSAAGQDQGMDYLKAEFRGIHAVGGLIEVRVPEWLSEGIDLNNDFDIVVSLKARKWIPLA